VISAIYSDPCRVTDWAAGNFGVAPRANLIDAAVADLGTALQRRRDVSHELRAIMRRERFGGAENLRHLVITQCKRRHCAFPWCEVRLQAH
jgi:hypothetical protein